MKSLCVKNEPRTDGLTIYDDELARAADLDGDRFLLEYGGRSIEFDLPQIAEATQALIDVVGTKLSVLAAARAILFDVEERLPADG